MKSSKNRLLLTACLLLLSVFWSLSASAQTGPIRVGIYQYQSSSASQQLPSPTTIQTAYETAFGAANVTISFVKAQQPWVTPADLPNVDVLWISRYRSQTGSAQELELISNFVKGGKHVVFSSIETHSTELNTIISNVIGRTFTSSSTSSGSSPFPNPTNLFGLATGLNNLVNTRSYDTYTNLPACNNVAGNSLFLIPSTTVRGGTLFGSGEIQSFSSLTSFNNADWQTLAGRIADLHRTYVYGTQAELVAKDTTNYLGSQCANDFVVAPSAQINTPINNAVINDNTPTISGAAGVGNTITVTIEDANGNVIETQTPVVAGDGTWSFDAMTLPDGDYTINATARNTNGDSIDAPPIVFTVDTMPPVVTITTPADGAVTNDDTPTISGTVESGSSVVVEILDTNGIVQTVTPAVDAMGNWSLDASQLPEGDFLVSVVGTDVAGNASAPTTSTFTVDTTPPAVTVTNLVDNTLTNDNTPTFDGTAEAGAAITVVVSDTNGVVQTLTTTTDAMGNWTVDAAQLPDGPYTFEVIGQDAAGNASAPISRTFDVDTVAPAVGISQPTNGATTNDNTPTIAGSVEAGATLMVTLTDANGMAQTLTPTITNGMWSIDAAQLADGPYTVTVAATDGAGNVGTAMSSFEVDTTPPALTLATPADGAQTNDDTPTITGTVEPGASATVTISDANGVVQTLTPTVDPMGNWSVDAAQLPEGDYTLNATATDNVGNTSMVGPTTFTVDTTAPALAITVPTTNQILDSRDVAVSGTSDANQVIQVELIDAQGNVVGTQSATTDAQGSWTANFSMVANGSYTARATTSDVAGNDVTVEQPFSVDSEEPMVAITAPADASATGEVRPAITGTTDVDATLSVSIKDAQGNEIATATPAVDANGDWTVALDQDLVDGDYTIDVTATRPNGKMATATSTFTVDTVAPMTTIVTPADGMVGSVNQPEITGTTEPGATVDVTVTNAAGTVVFTGQTTADDQGNWTITPDAPLADDTYTIDAKGTDVAGNEGAPVTSGFTVDTNAPTVTITSPANGETIEDNTPTISGTAEPGATVIIIVDGNEVGQATADDQGAWTFDLPEDQALGEGDHTIEATTTDDAGNAGTSGELTVTFAEPKEPVVITSPTQGENVTGPSVTVTGTGEPGEMVKVTIGGKETTVTVGDDGMWTATLDDILEGDQTVTAQSGDDISMIRIDVSYAPDAAEYLITGGSCSSTNSSPVSSLWLLGLFGLLALRRRRVA